MLTAKSPIHIRHVIENFQMITECASASVMEGFKRIGDALSLPDNRNFCIFNNDKIWFFGQDYVDQPDFQSGHHVVFNGSHVTFFDTKTNQWDTSRNSFLAPLSAEQNLEELLFLFHTQIFLFLFTAFGPMTNASLYYFNENNRTWTQHSTVKILLSVEDSKASVDKRRNLILAEGKGKNGVYFVDENFYVYELNINETNSTISTLGQIEAKKAPLRLQPTIAAFSSGKVFVQGGVHGCGFRYDPKRIYVFDLTSKTSKHLNITGKCVPVYGLSSSKLQAIDFPSKNSWTHFTGHSHIGLHNVSFNNEIWELKNLDTEPKWQRLSVKVPTIKNMADFCVAFDSASKQLFLIAKELGVVKIQIPN